jgi:hypothetical protein
MNDSLMMLARLLAKALLLTAGLVMAAGLALLVLLLAAGWLLYAGWARLTGRAVAPFVMRMDPRTGFARAWQRSQAAAPPSRTPRADATRAADTAQGRVLGRRAGEVADVEPRMPRA